MAKRSNIRWRTKDANNVTKIIRNYNAKIARIKRTHPHIAKQLPTTMSRAVLKSKVQTRADLNRELNSLKRFSIRGAEKMVTTAKGLVLTKHEIKETKNLVRIVNIKRALMRRKLGVSVQKGTIGAISSANLRPRQFSLNKTPKEWANFKMGLMKQVSGKFTTEKLESYKKNYILAVKNAFGKAGQPILDKIKDINAEDFFDKSFSNPVTDIEFVYDPKEAEIKVKNILREWGKLV